MVVRVDDDELARAHALAEAGDEPIATMFRRWIKERYVVRFGEAAPPVPKLKHGAKIA
jgi:hypothetical protein